MKVPYSWLLDHLDTDASVEAIAETLTTLGLEVEDISNPAQGLDGFEVAEILEAAPHPQADRLKVCRVRRGSGEVLQIVCGAPNARAGLKVVLALPAQKIPTTGQVLKLTAIRGVESQGMLCSTSELGLEEESNGIMELPSSAQVGDSLISFLGTDEVILDVNVTPNRSDCLSIRGIARELAAADIGTLKPLDIHKVPATTQQTLSVIADPQILETGACSHFSGRLIQGIKNGPSPDWLQKKLKAIGKNPISLVVDITNYLCFDLGRPMHAFDADQIEGPLHVRFAAEEEAFQSLKNEDYSLNSEMTLIADKQGALALGGIMGGLRGSCTSDTVNVFLESAYFSPTRTAATGRKLNILSDSRYRFERGIDPHSALLGLEYATQLILKWGGGQAGPIIEVGAPLKAQDPIAFDPQHIEKLTGLHIGEERIKSILEKLGFDYKEKMVHVPSWRHDIRTSVDLIEEVTRHYGYDHLPLTPLPFEKASTATPAQSRLIKLKHMLAGRGLHEAVTWSMVDEKSYNLFGGKDDNLRIINPITVDLEYMRPSIFPSLLKALHNNVDRGQNPVFLFEIGPVFKTLETQQTHITALRWGKCYKNHWAHQERWVDVFDIKADALAVLESCGLKEGNYQIVSQGAPSYYHPGRSAIIQQGPKNILGFFGELHPLILKHYDIKHPVVGMELNLGAIPPSRLKEKESVVLSPFQAIERDFAFIVSSSLEAGNLVPLIKKIDKDIITSVDIFDVYKGKEGDNIHKKSVAIRVRLEPQDKTFTDDEIQDISAKIIKTVETTTGGILRSEDAFR